MIVVWSYQQNNCCAIRHKRHDDSQVPDQVPDTQVLDHVPGKPVLHGLATLTSELSQKAVVSSSIVRPELRDLEICEWRSEDLRHRRSLLRLDRPFLVFGQSRGKLTTSQLAQALLQLVLIEQGGILQAVPDCVEEAPTLSCCAKFPDQM
ncbi:hypothetical protein [Streptomyces tendae]|uniref:Uncharacterized protein n=1 Tax=Streptomyces tendae TaxID=1932 RepID=A0A6B3QWZ1_STRTE|nr:hypothetical protein [Streptomyces tendae]NEV92519.1 hypothetical protein [Streptomyces tendae]